MNIGIILVVYDNDTVKFHNLGAEKTQTNVIMGQFEHMHVSSETPEMMILIVNHENISKLNNENFFKFGYNMGSRVFLKYTE